MEPDWQMAVAYLLTLVLAERFVQVALELAEQEAAEQARVDREFWGLVAADAAP